MILFQDSFETGFTPWTASGTNSPNALAEVIAAAAYAGALGGHFAVTAGGSGTDRAFCYKDFAPPTTGIAAAQAVFKPLGFGLAVQNEYLRLDNPLAPVSTQILLLICDHGVWALQIRRKDGVLASVPLTNPLALGTWYVVELQYDATGPSPVGRCYVDGVLQATITDASVGTLYVPSQVELRAKGTSAEAYYDSVVTADAAIGMGAPPTPSSLVLASVTPTLLQVGQPATITGTVRDQFGALMPGVVVTFLIDGTVFTSVATDATGVATMSFVYYSPGTHTVSAQSGSLQAQNNVMVTYGAVTTPVLSRVGTQFLMDGVPLTPFGERCANALQDQATTDRLLAALDAMKATGIDQIAISLQGARTGTVNAFNLDGSLDMTVMGRAAQVMDALAVRNMAAVLIYFYQERQNGMSDAAVQAAVTNATTFFLPYRHAWAMPTNEPTHPNWTQNYIRNNQAGIYSLVKTSDPNRIVYCTDAYNDGFTAHTTRTATGGNVAVEYVRPDDYASPGVFTIIPLNEVLADLTYTAQNGGFFFGHYAWLQLYGSMYGLPFPQFLPGGEGTAASPGIAPLWRQMASLTAQGAPTPTTLTIGHVGSSSNPVGTSHTVRATVTDQFGAPVPGVQVGFELNAGALQYVLTNSLGQADYTWIGTTVGRDYIKARLGILDSGAIWKDWVVATQTPTTISIAPVGSWTNPVGSNPGFVVGILDQNGQPMSGVSVDLLRGGPVFATQLTDGSGSTIFYLTSLVATTETIAARVTGTTLQTGPHTITWTAVPSVLTTIALAPVGPTSITAGGQGSVRATALDQFGVAMAGISIAFEVNGTVITSVATDASGNAPFTFIAPVAGTYTVLATSGSIVSGQVVFTATNPPPAPSTVALSHVGSPTNDVGVQHSVTAAVTDQYGSPMGGVSVALNSSVRPFNQAVTDAQGIATFSWTSQTAGVENLQAQAGVVNSNTITKTWTALVLMPATVSLALSSPSGSAFLPGETVSSIATVRDQNGAVMSGVNVSFYVNSVLVGSAVTNASGSAQLSWLAGSAGSYSVVASAGSISSVPVGYTVAAPVITYFTLTIAPSAQNVVGTQVVVQASIRDQTNLPMAGVGFDVLINGAVAATLTTDVNGQATFAWTSNQPGTQAVQGRAGINYSNILTVTWTPVPQVLTILNLAAVSATTLDVGQQAVIRATATDQNGQPMVGIPVSFYMDGVLQGAIQTVAGGTADFSLTESAVITHVFQARSGTVQSGTVSIAWQQPNPVIDIDHIDLAHDGPDVNQLGTNHSVVATVVFKLGAVPRILALDFVLNGTVAQTVNTDPIGQARFTWTRTDAQGEATDAIYASADGVNSPTLNKGWTATPPPASVADLATIGLAFAALVIGAIAIGKK